MIKQGKYTRKIEIVKSPFMILRSLIQVFQGHLKDKDVDFQMKETIQGDPKAIRLFKTNGIELDKDLYEQILYNVFINACKFNKKNGQILLTFAVYESSANRLKIETMIRDTGIGMKKNQLKKLGKVFENVRMANDLKDTIM